MRLSPLVACSLLVAGSAAAQPSDMQPGAPPPGSQMGAPHMNMRQRFDAANSTHDGRLTREQAQGAGMNMVVGHFDAIDTDRKGYVTFQDLRAFRQARQQARAARLQRQQPQQAQQQQQAPEQDQPPQ